MVESIWAVSELRDCEIAKLVRGRERKLEEEKEKKEENIPRYFRYIDGTTMTVCINIPR